MCLSLLRISRPLSSFFVIFFVFWVLKCISLTLSSPSSVLLWALKTKLLEVVGSPPNWRLVVGVARLRYVTWPLSTNQYSDASAPTNSSLWLIIITPPLNSRIATVSAPNELRSRKLVGSSRTKICGLGHKAAAKTTLTFGMRVDVSLYCVFAYNYFLGLPFDRRRGRQWGCDLRSLDLTPSPESALK